MSSHNVQHIVNADSIYLSNKDDRITEHIDIETSGVLGENDIKLTNMNIDLTSGGYVKAPLIRTSQLKDVNGNDTITFSGGNTINFHNKTVQNLALGAGSVAASAVTSANGYASLDAELDALTTNKLSITGHTASKVFVSSNGGGIVTSSVTTTDLAKLSNIAVSQAVNLDTIETRANDYYTNGAKTNASNNFGGGSKITTVGGGGASSDGYFKMRTGGNLSEEQYTYLVAPSHSSGEAEVFINLPNVNGTLSTLALGTSSSTALAGNTSLLALGTSSSTALAGNTSLLALGTSSSTALAGNTSLLQLGTSSSTALAGNTSLLQLGTSSSTALAGNTSLLALGTSSSTALAGNTSLLQLGTSSSTALAGNTTTISGAQATSIGATATQLASTNSVVGGQVIEQALMKLKTDRITVTQAVNLDSMESNIATNNAKQGISSTQSGNITTNNAKKGVSKTNYTGSSYNFNVGLTTTSNNGVVYYSTLFKFNPASTRLQLGNTTAVCSLHISTTSSVYTAGGAGYWYNGGHGAGYASAAGRNLGLKVEGTVWFSGNSGIHVTSDRRVKQNIVEVDDDLALQQLRAIDVMYYDYIDKQNYSEGQTIGFISQQVKEVIPMAVQIQGDYLPDEMREAEVTFEPFAITDEDNTPIIKYKFAVDGLSGNKYKFKMLNGDEVETVELEKDEDGKFTCDTKYDETVYVYGKWVDDFHILSKSKLFTVNFSATQQIDKNQIVLQQKVATLENELALIKAQVEMLISKV